MKKDKSYKKCTTLWLQLNCIHLIRLTLYEDLNWPLDVILAWSCYHFHLSLIQNSINKHIKCHRVLGGLYEYYVYLVYAIVAISLLWRVLRVLATFAVAYYSHGFPALPVLSLRPFLVVKRSIAILS